MAIWINIHGCQSCPRMTICVVISSKTIAIVRDCMYTRYINKDNKAFSIDKAIKVKKVISYPKR